MAAAMVAATAAVVAAKVSNLSIFPIKISLLIYEKGDGHVDCRM